MTLREDGVGGTLGGGRWDHSCGVGGAGGRVLGREGGSSLPTGGGAGLTWDSSLDEAETEGTLRED